ncbi:hypothetical protein CEXT_68951 [Caerostris extrusa]|uniref:Uncharacterized protein n=1 Tax=Caerostris extrusa TaxID=172846 RepID=A0AAV4TGC4_CAEEX|nr:hypothetical protein CEXT_68951 [Caerostris extrusa]
MAPFASVCKGGAPISLTTSVEDLSQTVRFASRLLLSNAAEIERTELLFFGKSGSLRVATRIIHNEKGKF